MKYQSYKLVLFTTTMIIMFVVIVGGVVAQENNMITPLDLSNEPVVVEFSTSAAGPPIIEPLTDGRMAFRITAGGDISGTISGSITARITEVTANPSPVFHPITVMFTIETEVGMMEGYYVGSFIRTDGPDGPDHANVNAAGKILSVSGAYADLYLADVFVTTTVQYEDGRSVADSGTMTIAAR